MSVRVRLALEALGESRRESVVLGGACGQDVFGPPFPASVRVAIEGANVFRGSTMGNERVGLGENTRQTWVREDLAVDLVNRNLEQTGRAGKIPLGDMDRSGDLIDIERNGVGARIPRVEW